MVGITSCTIAGESTSSTVVAKITEKTGTSIRILMDEKTKRTQDITITENTVIRRARQRVTLDDVTIGEIAGIVIITVDGKATATVVELHALR